MKDINDLVFNYEAYTRQEQERVREQLANETPEERLKNMSLEARGANLEELKKQAAENEKAKKFADKHPSRKPLSEEEQKRVDLNLRKAAWAAKQPKPKRTPEARPDNNLMQYKVGKENILLRLPAGELQTENVYTKVRSKCRQQTYNC